MIELSVKEIAEACGGEIASGLSDIATFTTMSTDSRTVQAGDLFVALKGEHFDAHNFLTSVVDKGAMGIVASRTAVNPFLKRIPKQYLHVTLILVDDTLRAYQDIARLALRKMGAKTVAVTGSTGKTTTKDMIASILRTMGKTAASRENFNNEYGLPAAILQADPDVKYMVLEMGMRGLGQIAELARVARPNVGVITNVGLTHYELLGSEENIALAKAELAGALRDNATLVLNADDKWSETIAEQTKARVVTFGIEAPADIAARDIRMDETGRAGFRIEGAAKGKAYAVEIKLKVPGRHNVLNALAAAAAAGILGASGEQIKSGLESFAPAGNRMNVVETSAGVVVINDTYNANPTSMAAAIAALADIGGTRKIAVLGDMLELGEASDKAHREVGRLCAQTGIDMLIAAGDLAEAIAEGAIKAGMPAGIVIYSETPEEAARILAKEIRAGDVVLVKASRALRFERIAECIK